MTKKQITTLILFAQNYSIKYIARAQKVSVSSIRQRIKSLSENHSKEFNNAFAVRESYKRIRDGIRTPTLMGLGIHGDYDWKKGIENTF